MFDAQRLTLRRNVWRSLFVLDCLISASMGRPAAISNNISKESFESPQRGSSGSSGTTTHTEAFDAVVGSCLSIDQILLKLYAERGVSTEVGHEFLAESMSRARTCQPKLDSGRLLRQQLPPDEAVAVLHADLVETYSVILLTRPFFLSYVISIKNEGKRTAQEDSTDATRLEGLSESCVAASTRIIALLHTTYLLNHHTPHNSFHM